MRNNEFEEQIKTVNVRDNKLNKKLDLIKHNPT